MVGAMTRLLYSSSCAASCDGFSKWRGIERSWYKLAANWWQSQENTSAAAIHRSNCVIQSDHPPTIIPNGQQSRHVYFMKKTTVALAEWWHNGKSLLSRRKTLWPDRCYCVSETTKPAENGHLRVNLLHIFNKRILRQMTHDIEFNKIHIINKAIPGQIPCPPFVWNPHWSNYRTLHLYRGQISCPATSLII